MTIKEVQNYIRFTNVRLLTLKNIDRASNKYQGFEFIVQKPPSGRNEDNVPLVGVVHDKELVALYVDESLVTPERIDLFFSENKIKRPRK